VYRLRQECSLFAGRSWSFKPECNNVLPLICLAGRAAWGIFHLAYFAILKWHVSEDKQHRLNDAVSKFGKGVSSQLHQGFDPRFVKEPTMPDTTRRAITVCAEARKRPKE
jgi:hypothetical protein